MLFNPRHASPWTLFCHSASVIYKRGIKQHFDAGFDYGHEQEYEYEM
jgi:hypothetical protein